MKPETEQHLMEEHPDEPAPKRGSWFRDHLGKVGRVVAYGLTVAGVGCALAAGSAYGSIEDAALDVGAELDKLGDIGHKTPIILNGQPIKVGSSVHELTVSETLDRAEALCEHGTLTGSDGGQQMVPDSDQVVDSGQPAMGILRQEEDGRGVVLCFAPAEGQPPIGGVGDKLERWLTFLASGELDALGRLRYLYARETDTGRTHLIRVWTDAPFNLYSFVAHDGGDAPGTDPGDMPRPLQSVRLLSATVDTADYAVRVYDSALRPHEITAYYDTAMPLRGWTQSVRDGHTRVYTRGDISVFVTPTVNEGRTLVSLLHMGGDAVVADNGADAASHDN